jgi:hypothetical protein
VPFGRGHAGQHVDHTSKRMRGDRQIVANRNAIGEND